MTKDTGGPAFPDMQSNGKFKGFSLAGGMDLRDYMAGQALVGLLPTKDGKELTELRKSGLNPARMVADEAYSLADAMLRARVQS